MENKINIDSLYVKECLLNEDGEIPIEWEFILPDYCQPVKKVLSYIIEPNITSKNITGNTLKIDGISSFKLIYLDEDDCISSYISTFTFSKNYECNFDFDDNKLVELSAVADSFNCRITSARRMELKGIIKVNLIVYSSRKISYVTDDNCDYLETLCCKSKVNSNIIFKEKNIIIDDEISLSDSHEPIGKILTYKSEIITDECKIMTGKVMLRGTLIINVTYLSSNDYRPCHFEQKIPYSQVCDIEGINEDFKLVTNEKVVFLEVKCRSGGYEDGKTMLVNSKINIVIEAYNKKEINTVIDAYSKIGNADIKCQNIDLENILDSVRDSFIAKKNLAFSEGDLNSIIDIESNARVNNIKKSKDEVIVYGTVTVRIIFNDASGHVDSCERMIDFEYKYKLQQEVDNLKYKSRIMLTNLSYIITSDSNIEIVCEMNIILDLFEISKICIITDALISNEGIEQSTDSAIYVCFAEDDSDLWTIAKEYKSSLNEIRQLNSLDEDCTKVSGAVVIPVK